MNTRRHILFCVVLGATALALVAHILLIFLATPMAQPQAGGFAQKIFYFHVPAAYAMYLCGAACFFGSAAYLASPTEGKNALARGGAEAAVLFGTMMMISGMLWAKKAWGVYWVWDPRLTTLLLSVVIYIAVVVLRAPAPTQEPKLRTRLRGLAAASDSARCRKRRLRTCRAIRRWAARRRDIWFAKSTRLAE